MNRSSINKNKNLSSSQIYSDTVSLNLYNRPSNKYVDDTRSVCVRGSSKRSSNNLSSSKISNSRLLNNLSLSQSKSISNTQQRSNLRKTRLQSNLSQSLTKPPIKQVSKPNNTIKPQQKQPIKQLHTTNKLPSKTLNKNVKSNEGVIFPNRKPIIKQNTQPIQKNILPQTPKPSPIKIIPKIIQSSQPVIVKSVNQQIQTNQSTQINNQNNNQTNKQEQKPSIPKININNIMELDTKSQSLNTNKSITIKSPQNIDNYTEYNGSYIECVSDNSRYVIKPEYLIFQKATDYKSYYGIDHLKLSLIDKNQNTLSATTINPLSISTKEINLYTGSIEKEPSKEKDIVNKKYVDEQLIKINDNEKVNKHITKLADQMNKNIDAINSINQRITKINTNISINLKELNQKISENKNIFNDDIKNEIKSEIKKDFSNNSLVVNNLTANEITVNKLNISESFEHIKFNSILDCNNILLHNIECMHNGTYNSLEIKLDNRNDIHIFDDDNNNFSFKPYTGIIESDNGITLQKYGEYDENATKITSEDIMTKRIYLSDVDENGCKTDIIIRPINIDGKPKIQFIMKCEEEEVVFYMP